MENVKRNVLVEGMRALLKSMRASEVPKGSPKGPRHLFVPAGHVTDRLGRSIPVTRRTLNKNRMSKYMPNAKSPKRQLKRRGVGYA